MNHAVTVRDIFDVLTEEENNEVGKRSLDGFEIMRRLLMIVKSVTGAEDLEELYYSRKGYNSEETV
jgi:hypothetical protein